MLDLHHDITRLRGAEYNPRKIADEDIAVLAESIKRLGLVKPLIVRGDLLVAGHQRTRALRHLGVTTAAVYVLPRQTTTYDEVRFNQLHNGTDLDSGDEHVRIGGGFEAARCFVQVDPRRIAGNFRSRMANVRQEICDLILAYGPWGASVATQSGKIIHCAQYALSAAVTRTPLTCYVVPDDREAEYAAFLGRQYGRFSYAALPKDTFIQTFAQMMRLRAGPSGKGNKSTLYETMVMPWLHQRRGARLIDFGSGQGDYAAALRRAGFKIHDIEFFRRVPGKQAIDVGAVHRMIDDALSELSRRGPFDAVVCDSVMNCVDCLEAETLVMTMLNALCRPGGAVFFSGRRRDRLDSQDRFTMATGGNRLIEFLDDDGFSCLYRNGRWFYQKFHDDDQIHALAENHGLTVRRHTNGQTTSWQVEAAKVRELPAEKVDDAIRYEFNLPVSDTRRIGRHDDALAVFAAMREQGRANADAGAEIRTPDAGRVPLLLAKEGARVQSRRALRPVPDRRLREGRRPGNAGRRSKENRRRAGGSVLPVRRVVAVPVGKERTPGLRGRGGRSREAAPVQRGRGRD